jgi:hypothetical protein
MIVLCGLSTRLFLADRGELLLEVLLAVCGELLFLEEVLLSTEMILVVVSCVDVAYVPLGRHVLGQALRSGESGRLRASAPDKTEKIVRR